MKKGRVVRFTVIEGTTEEMFRVQKIIMERLHEGYKVIPGEQKFGLIPISEQDELADLVSDMVVSGIKKEKRNLKDSLFVGIVLSTERCM